MTNSESPMANGRWRIADGKSPMANRRGQIADGKLRIANRRWQTADGEPLVTNLVDDGKLSMTNRQTPNTHLPWAICHRRWQIGKLLTPTCHGRFDYLFINFNLSYQAPKRNSQRILFPRSVSSCTFIRQRRSLKIMRNINLIRLRKKLTKALWAYHGCKRIQNKLSDSFFI